MIVKVSVDLYVDTEDPERVCSLLAGHAGMGLEGALRDFPGGAVLQADVEGYSVLTVEQERELGLEEF